jgi:hypothetical protein
MGQAENPTMYAVEQVCGLYGVQVTREQSRSITVESGGRWRPMFFGQWTDEFGKRRFGKADFLARPRIRTIVKVRGWAVADGDGIELYLPTPLWIECKSLEGDKNRRKNLKTMGDQEAFKRWVESNGDFYLHIVEDVRPLIAWFEAHGVVKNCDEVALATVVTPLDSTELYLLPCKHCGYARAQHRGKIFSCPMELAGCSSKLIGKVWSPDLRKGVKAKGVSA